MSAALAKSRMPRRHKSARRAGRRPKKLSRQEKPQNMSLEEWQTELRRQFGREQKFKLKNLGERPVFSQFRVTNPENRNAYRVEIRGSRPGDNFCSCPDFATNTLGTCKHVEFTLARLERLPGAKAALREGFQPGHSEIVLKYGARREVCFLPGSECPPGLAVLAAEYFDADRTLRPEAFGRFEKFLAAAGGQGGFEHDLRCHDDALAFIAEVRDRENRRERVDEAFPKGIHSAAFDKLLKTRLYDYQRQGALFAARAGRCLIGDEMGLGKTIQAIGAAEIMARHLGATRVLIICPTSLKHQWEREIARFTDRSACVIGGLRARRQELFAQESFFKITNYDTIHRDVDLIAQWSPDLVILDEAQRIKNWKTRAARNVKKIVSPFAIVLTGTPLENRLEELVSIVQFVDQHRLGPTFRFLADHQLLDPESGRVVGYRSLDAIGKTLEPILIRRRKDQVLKQLPERLDKNFFVRMTPEQQNHHDENREIVGRIVLKWRRQKFLSEADQRRLMIALQNMRMSCNSTYLLDQTTDFGCKADELATLLDEMFERPETKVVIFSQWVRTHELIQRRLKARGIGHVLFHGGVPGDKRRGLVDQFREDADCRVFLSTDAGGVGLNLQHASVVINMDLPWNPAVLEQRIGRVHRLGQSRPVQVVNFVSKGTIEEGMLEVIRFKKSLFSGALDGGEKEVFFQGGRLKQFMETVEKASASIPEAIPEDTAATIEAADTNGEVETAQGRGSKDLHAVAGSTDMAGAILPTPSAADGWPALLQTGLALLEQLTSAASCKPAPMDGSGTARPRTVVGPSMVRHDADTGKPYLHLPMPSPDVLERVFSAAGDWLKNMRG